MNPNPFGLFQQNVTCECIPSNYSTFQESLLFSGFLEPQNRSYSYFSHFQKKKQIQLICLAYDVSAIHHAYLVQNEAKMPYFGYPINLNTSFLPQYPTSWVVCSPPLLVTPMYGVYKVGRYMNVDNMEMHLHIVAVKRLEGDRSHIPCTALIVLVHCVVVFCNDALCV